MINNILRKTQLGCLVCLVLGQWASNDSAEVGISLYLGTWRVCQQGCAWWAVSTES